MMVKRRLRANLALVIALVTVVLGTALASHGTEAFALGGLDGSGFQGSIATTPSSSGEYQTVSSATATAGRDSQAGEFALHLAMSAGQTPIDAPVRPKTDVEISTTLTGTTDGVTLTRSWVYEPTTNDQSAGSTAGQEEQADSDNKWIFSPESQGTYWLKVEAVRPDGARAVAMLVLNVREQWNYTGFSLDKTKVELGESVTAAASVSGPDAAVARFDYRWAYEGQAQDEGSFATDLGHGLTDAQERTFTPSRVGTYKLTVIAYHTDGSSESAERTITVTAWWKAAGLAGRRDVSRLGDALPARVTFAAGSNTRGLTYDFGWKNKVTGETWSLVASGSAAASEPSHSYSLPAVGDYELTCVVIGTDGSKQTVHDDVSVRPPFTATGLSAGKGDYELGETVTLRPQATGDLSSSSLSFAWNLTANGGEGSAAQASGTASVSTAPGSGSTFAHSFVPTKWGDYSASMTLTAPDGTAYPFQTSFRVQRGWNADLLLDKSGAQYVNTPIELSCVTDGARAGELSFDYSWSRDKGAASGSSGVTKQKSFTFTPNHSGDYTFKVTVHDERTGQQLSYTKSMRINKRWSLARLTPGYASPLRPYSWVKLTASITGDASGLSYDFGWMRDNWAEGTSNGRKGVLATTNSTDWQIGGSGWYTFFVTVKDKNGETEYTQVSGVRGFSAWDNYKRVYDKLNGEAKYKGGQGWKYENALTSRGGTLCNYSHGYWCANFLWWGFYETGSIDLWGPNSLQVDPEYLANDYALQGRTVWNVDNVQVGDILFVYWNSWRKNQGITHAALVTGVDGDRIYTIEGNMNDQIIDGVYLKSNRGSGRPVAYARPNW